MNVETAAVEAPDNGPSKYQRRWKDLRLARLMIALCLAATPSTLLSMTLVWFGVFFDGPVTFDRTALYVAIYFPAALVWSLASGLSLISIVAWWRGLIGRTTCLLVGCAGAFWFPTFAFLLGNLYAALDFGRPVTIHADDVQYLSLGGLAAIPFGLLGGWLFWRIGVRPAVMKTGDFAAVFD